MSRALLTDRGKFYLELFLAIIILALGFVFAFFLFDKVFIKQDQNYLTNTISAFLGAFIAFIFIRFTEFLDKLFKRKTKHRDALISLEKLGNEYLNTISDNIFIIDEFTKIANEKSGQLPPFIYFNELHEFKYDKTIIKGLTNLEIINDQFSFEASVEKMNSSLRSTNRFYITIRDALVSGNIDPQTYFQNVSNLIEKLLELKAFLKNLENENLDLMTKVRILIHDEESFYTRVLRRILKKELTYDQKMRIPGERKKLEEEIKQTEEQSRARIDVVERNIKGKLQ